MTARPKQLLPAVRAGVYTQISADSSGQRGGVDRQRADCEAHCQTRGWEVVEVFCDNHASAYGRKPRRAYERMLAAVDSGSIDAIVTWHNDGLSWPMDGGEAAQGGTEEVAGRRVRCFDQAPSARLGPMGVRAVVAMREPSRAPAAVERRSNDTGHQVAPTPRRDRRGRAPRSCQRGTPTAPLALALFLRICSREVSG